MITLPDARKLSRSPIGLTGAAEIRSRNITNISYAYDQNGNRTSDGRTGLEFTYNLLNLPCEVRDSQDNMQMRYTYLSDGTKVSALSTDSAFRYRYAGKEEQRFGSFDSQLLDFGARYYDAYTCRWNAIDPLANNFYNRTPYNYCGNDPVNRFDSDGRVEIVVRTAVGLVVGAAIGGIVAYSTGKNGKEFWGSVANGAVAGGVTAATAGLGGNIAVTQLFTGAATGAIAGASGTATEQLITEGHLDGVEIAKGAAEGVVNCVITRGVSKIAQTAVNNSAASINSKYTAGSKEMKAITKEVQSEMKEQGFSISGKSGKQELRQRVFQRVSTFKKVETSAAATTINAAKEIHNYGSSAVREVIYENQKK